MLDHALRYLAAGLSIIPMKAGTKQPAFRLLPRVCVLAERAERAAAKKLLDKPIWEPYATVPPTEDEVRAWFKHPGTNIAIVGGRVSGGLCIFDFDVDADATYARWCARVGSIATALPTVKTGKGYHVYFRCASPGGNQTLALDEDEQVLIQTRGEHGYVLAPPSVHPSGATYRMIHGDLTDIPYLG